MPCESEVQLATAPQPGAAFQPIPKPVSLDLRHGYTADCGAGIGRVTKHLLLGEFDHVDLLEQSPRLIAEAPKFIGAAGSDRVTCICQGMQVCRSRGRV